MSSSPQTDFETLYTQAEQANCLFCKIVRGDIPSFRVYEDDAVIAFLDIKPVNPGHVLVVPRTHSQGFHDAAPETLEKLIIATQKVAKAILAATGVPAFNLEQNNGEVAGQVIPHLHIHIIPRVSDDGLKHWPGKEYPEGEIARIQESIRAVLS